MKNSALTVRFLFIILGFAAFTLSSCEDSSDDMTPDDPRPATVVDVITGSDDHTTLAAAVAAADLVETLSGNGPFTVFAPTDAAFAALPAGTVEALLQNPSGDLSDILRYHVIGDRVLSGALSDGLTAQTVLGSDLSFTINEQGAFVNGARITVADIETQNGVVHVIDAVLIPPVESDPLPQTVVDIIAGSAVHETLTVALIAAGLIETLQGEGPFTVFAPVDDAFNALPAGTLEALLEDPSGDLTNILLYHVVAANALSAGLSDGQSIETVSGETLVVTINDDGIFIGDAMVIAADIEAENGVVHVVNSVLLP
jgi:uncharacterized surface protein with fasciclin (FAS1) repeats